MTELNNFITEIIDKDLQREGNKKNINTRFPPEPNGYLHIGHAKSIFLNFGIAAKYKGSCNLRFDDTNPTKENIDYVNSIINDVEWLGFKCKNNVLYASNYFDKMYEYALGLINSYSICSGIIFAIFCASPFGNAVNRIFILFQLIF